MRKLERIERKIIDWPDFKNLIVNNNDQPKFITYLNPYTSTLAFQNIYDAESVDHFVLDGVITSKYFNIFNRCRYRTLSFDFSHAAGDVFEQLCCHDISLALIGAKPEELDQFEQKLKSRHPDLNIIYTHHGYIKTDAQLSEIVNNLNKAKPKFILLSAGAPLQETLGLKIKNQLTYPAIINTCGAFFSQTVSAKRESYYPPLIDKLSLRWLYRLVKEKHIRKRWLTYYPRFLLCYPILKLFKA